MINHSFANKVFKDEKHRIITTLEALQARLESHNADNDQLYMETIGALVSCNNTLKTLNIEEPLKESA